MFSLLTVLFSILGRPVYPWCLRWGLDVGILYSFNGRNELFGKRALETTVYLPKRHRYNVSIEGRRQITLRAILVSSVFADLGKSCVNDPKMA